MTNERRTRLSRRAKNKTRVKRANAQGDVDGLVRLMKNVRTVRKPSTKEFIKKDNLNVNQLLLKKELIWQR